MISYTNKVILAPMVRAGTLPFRLLALHYGADLVYTEEIVDHKILTCNRMVNDVLETVDFVGMNVRTGVAFRTCQLETTKVIFQLGTCDPERALNAGKMLENDISGLDINMGCPKEFSIQGGMGAALLTKPEKVDKILRTLVFGLSIPVTCKIRILPKLADTISLVKLIEKTGVKAIGVHGRMKEERSSQPCHDDIIAIISEAVNIPVIANGGSRGIKNYEDIQKFRDSTRCSSVMLARAAQWDPSVFRKEGYLSLMEVMKDYVKFAVRYDLNIHCIRYALFKMIKKKSSLKCEHVVKKVVSAKDVESLCIALDLHHHWKCCVSRRES